MNRIRYAALLSLLLVVFFVPAAFAQPGARILYPEGLQLGLGVASFNYKEPDIDIKMDGVIYGPEASFIYRNPNRPGLYMNLDASYNFGHLDYDGFTWGGTPIQTSSHNDFWELGARFGYDIPLSAFSRFTPFLGLGYRYWKEDAGSDGGYKREIRYLYSPIGVEIAWLLSSKWSLTLNGEYDIFWHGKVKSYLSEFGYLDADNTQNSGYGMRASIDFRKELDGRLTLSIKPFIRYWDIKDSDYVDIGYGLEVQEPANRTTEAGVLVSLNF